MRDEDRRAFHALCAAQAFLQEHRQLIRTAGQLLLVQHLDAIIDTAYKHIAARAAADLRGPLLAANVEALLGTLRRDHLQHIVAIGRADLPHTPEFEVLRMPAGRPTLDQVVALARAMGALAERYPGVFIAMGKGPDFIDTLHAAIEALLRARDARTAMKAQRHGAVVGLVATIAEGRSVLARIDAELSIELHHDVVLHAIWRSVSATPRKRGRPRKRRLRPRRRPDDDQPPPGAAASP